MQTISQDKKQLFESVSIPKAIAAMAIPTIISQLINLVYNMVDTIYIGMTGDAFKTASITLAFTIFMMTVALANLFGIGGGSLIARLTGANRQEDAKKVSAFSFYGAIGIAIAYSALILVFLDPVLKLLGASDATIGYARQYVWIVVIIGDVPVILSMVCAHLLRNTGYSRQASIGLSGGGILNIVLDPLFMFVLLPDGMEVVGAALATLLANVIACIYLITVMKNVSDTSPLSIRLRDAFAIRKPELKSLFAVGVPSAVLVGLFDIGNIFLNSLMASHSDLQLAAIGITMKAERLPNAINIGLCQGALPLIAYNYSSGNWERMNKVMRTTRVYGLTVAIASCVLYQIFAPDISHLFMNTSARDAVNAIATVGFATVFLRYRCFASVPQFLNYSTSYTMQAVGNGRDTLIHSFARQLAFNIPIMYLLNALFGANGLVLALVAAESCSAAFALLLLQRWKRKRLVRAENNELKQGECTDV